MGGLRVDAAIDREVVRVLAPGAIEAALATEARAADDTATAPRAVELELRDARYEAERAQRQYDVVEPEHRLVAETLEARWNAALERVRGLEQRLATPDSERRLVADRATLLRLAEDFPGVWSAPTTDIRTKKRIVRLLIEEIVVTAITGSRPQVGLLIHWKGGTHTRLVIARNRTGQHGRSTDRAVVDVVRALARSLADAHIGRVLNRLGYRTGADHTWTQARVASLRQYHEIPDLRPSGRSARPADDRGGGHRARRERGHGASDADGPDPPGDPARRPRPVGHSGGRPRARARAASGRGRSPGALASATSSSGAADPRQIAHIARWALCR
jgi:hypothetical protein